MPRQPRQDNDDDEDSEVSGSYDYDQRKKHTKFIDLTNGKGGERVESEEGDEAEEEDEDEEDEEGEEDDEDDGVLAGSPSSAQQASRGRNTAVDPSTPGRVVDGGQEHTGRWTKEEHEAFLQALQMYGKEWKKVAAKVKTRTVVQTRTHAQKYFQKLQKAVEQSGKEDITQVEMGVSSSAKKASAQKKRPRGSTPIAPKPHRRSSNATLSAAQVISNLSSSQPIGPFVATGSSSKMSSSGATQPPRHGFSTSNDNDGFPTPFSWQTGSGMKIIAPDPTSSLMKGFPEPSPAATGKRKLAEIAAARMLAEVAGTRDSRIDDEGPPTPPPPSVDDEGRGLDLKEAPRLPLFRGVPDVSAVRKPGALCIVNPESLGISFGEGIKRKRGLDGENSPVTPWDGQLEALISEQAKFDAAAKPDPGESSSEDRPLVGSPSSTILPVCGPSTAFDRSPLHQSVCERDVESVNFHLEQADKVVLNTSDESGYCPLHSACALGLTEENAMTSCEIVRLLIEAGADLSKEDTEGNTPLHWASRAGDKEVVLLLLIKNARLDAKNKKGETPLHWAMRAGKRSMPVVALLLDNGARPGLVDSSFKRPIDVPGEGFLDEERSIVSIKAKLNAGKKVSKDYKKLCKETSDERSEARANLLIRSPQSRTLVLHHPECLEHHPKSEHDWEAPDRILSIMRRVVPSSDSTGATETSGIFPHEVTVSKEFEKASLDLLRRVHSPEYLSFVSNLSKDLERQVKEAGGSLEESEHGFAPPPAVIPFTPMVQRSMIKVEESSVKLSHLSDTAFSAGSLRAARRAAGAVQHAVDCVLVGRHRNAFCVVRPPGHHAGVNGLLEGGESCGFCIFNNVAAGALYAISEDRLLCDRCAIVDIDVHHGNGTEEIVRKYHDPSKLFFFSIHLYDNDKKKRTGNQFVYKFYPGTGGEDDLALNIINVPIVPLWKEQASQPVTTRTHNTRNKARANTETPEDTSETGTGRGSDAGSEAGSASGALSSPGSGSFSGRLAYRQAVQSRLLPALRAFNPDLILISAGFDASKGDVGNARHERGGKERIGLDLEPEDYAWVTRKILEIADICCQGRVVSVLEGGYGRTQKPELNQKGLDRGIFAECAVRHLHAMIDPYDTESRFV